MFLAELQLEEKKAFLELASRIAKIDGNLSIFEASILDKYRKEMDLTDYQTKGLALEEILPHFNSERSKKIVLAELFQLIFADGVFHDLERDSVRMIKTHFGFDEKEYNSFKDWVDKIRELSKH
ncbi:hypothetical protein [Neobacillus sp. Marseille-QA0830]